jgi:hypothetical protein
MPAARDASSRSSKGFRVSLAGNVVPAAAA